MKNLMDAFRWPRQEPTFAERKRRKLKRIRRLIKRGLPYTQTSLQLDFLTDTIRHTYNIVDTANVSANNYDPSALSIIDNCKQGFVLDCGAGKQATYYDNVVNFEIVAYDSTDVLGVGEELPFKDNTFDAVLSLNVLEHVKQPFLCAAEIVRVLKPGGTLYCVVPFLQPLHAYPHHYYNMSAQGLANLFEGRIDIQQHEVIANGLPIWTLTWFLRSWLDGLEGQVQQHFREMSVGDLIGSPIDYLNQPFVTQLSTEKNFELASTTALVAKKRGQRGK